MLEDFLPGGSGKQQPQMLIVSSSHAVDLYHFVAAIGHTIHPDPPRTGELQCIAGKRSSSFSVPENETEIDGKSTESKSKKRPLYTETQPLSESERAELLEILTDNKLLARLHERMTDAEIEGVLEIYRALPQRPRWEPHIYSYGDRSDIRMRRLDFQAKQKSILLGEVTEGRVRIFDSDRKPLKALGWDVLLPPSDAREYLKRIGIASAEFMGGVLEDSSLNKLDASPTSSEKFVPKEKLKPWTDEECKRLWNFFSEHGRKKTEEIHQEAGYTRMAVFKALKKCEKVNEAAAEAPAPSQLPRAFFRQLTS